MGLPKKAVRFGAYIWGRLSLDFPRVFPPLPRWSLEAVLEYCWDLRQRELIYPLEDQTIWETEILVPDWPVTKILRSLIFLHPRSSFGGKFWRENCWGMLGNGGSRCWDLLGGENGAAGPAIAGISGGLEKMNQGITLKSL